MPIRHELNTKEEMLKRLCYVLYVGSLFFGFLFAIIAFATVSPAIIIAAVALAAAAYTLRTLGIRYLEFPRLAISFPMGAPEDALSKETRVRFEKLLFAFHQERDWMGRQAIRQSIHEMVAKEPLLVSAFMREITEVHPTLLAELRSISE
jgi:hypothetical protein